MPACLLTLAAVMLNSEVCKPGNEGRVLRAGRRVVVSPHLGFPLSYADST